MSLHWNFAPRYRVRHLGRWHDCFLRSRDGGDFLWCRLLNRLHGLLSLRFLNRLGGLYRFGRPYHRLRPDRLAGLGHRCLDRLRVRRGWSDRRWSGCDRLGWGLCLHHRHIPPEQLLGRRNREFRHQGQRCTHRQSMHDEGEHPTGRGMACMIQVPTLIVTHDVTASNLTTTSDSIEQTPPVGENPHSNDVRTAQFRTCRNQLS